MTTSYRVTITRIQWALFRVTCTCTHEALRDNRYEADQHARSHQRTHATGDEAA